MRLSTKVWLAVGAAVTAALVAAGIYEEKKHSSGGVITVQPGRRYSITIRNAVGGSLPTQALGLTLQDVQAFVSQAGGFGASIVSIKYTPDGQALIVEEDNCSGQSTTVSNPLVAGGLSFTYQDVGSSTCAGGTNPGGSGFHVTPIKANWPTWPTWPTQQSINLGTMLSQYTVSLSRGPVLSVQLPDPSDEMAQGQPTIDPQNAATFMWSAPKGSFYVYTYQLNGPGTIGVRWWDKTQSPWILRSTTIVVTA